VVGSRMRAPTPPTLPSNRHPLRRMLLQHLLEIPARMASGMLRHLLRRAGHHDLADLIAAFRNQFYRGQHNSGMPHRTRGSSSVLVKAVLSALVVERPLRSS